MNAGRSAAVVAAAALAALAPDPAAALWDDRIEVFASQAIGHDDNLFRLPREADPEVILGTPATGARYQATSVGLNFDVPLSAQRFVGHLSRSLNRYNRFSSLDFDGHSLQADWLWKAGRQFDGRLGYSDERLLGSFANLQGGILSKTPNVIQIRETVVEGGYKLAPQWELRGALAERRHDNDAPEFQISNARMDSTNVTLWYSARSANRLGLSVESQDGRLPNPQLVDGVLIDNSYDQRSVALLVDWTMTAQSRLNVSVGHVSRRYPQNGQRDFADWIFSTAYEWQPTRRLSLTALAERDISASEEINIGFVFVERYALRPTLRISDTLELSASLERRARDYLGDPGLQALEGGRVTEDSDVTALMLTWTPTRSLRLNLSWRHDSRDSNLSIGSYDAEIASLEVRVAF